MNTNSLKALLEKEDELIRKKNKIFDNIVSNLYIIDEAPMFGTNAETVERCRKENDELDKLHDKTEAEIKNTQKSIKHYLLRLFED